LSDEFTYVQPSTADGAEDCIPLKQEVDVHTVLPPTLEQEIPSKSKYGRGETDTPPL
jgi:hypothetical protein